MQRRRRDLHRTGRQPPIPTGHACCLKVQEPSLLSVFPFAQCLGLVKMSLLTAHWPSFLAVTSAFSWCHCGFFSARTMWWALSGLPSRKNLNRIFIHRYLFSFFPFPSWRKNQTFDIISSSSKLYESNQTSDESTALIDFPPAVSSRSSLSGPKISLSAKGLKEFSEQKGQKKGMMMASPSLSLACLVMRCWSTVIKIPQTERCEGKKAVALVVSESTKRETIESSNF